MRRVSIVGALIAAILGLTVGSASAFVPTTPFADPPDIDVAKVQAHLGELQKVADANGGNRAVGGAGYDASVDYIAGKLEAAGYTVTRQKCETCTGQQENVITETAGGDETKVLMLGAHLDSVESGPGINDNGSGSAALLELALTLAEQNPDLTQKVRFAWWTAEETGLEGSYYYVENLGQDELGKLTGYLNFDMVGSPNAGYFVYNNDPAIAQVFQEYFTSISIESELDDSATGRSDHAAFDEAGVPVGGLFTGAEGTMTDEQASKWEGTAGEAYDKCYHSSCDTTENINETALDRMTDASAHAVWTLATA